MDDEDRSSVADGPIIQVKNNDRDQSTLPQIQFSLPQMEAMKIEINKLKRMKRIDDHEFKMLKIITGYKHPEEIKMQKIANYRKEKQRL